MDATADVTRALAEWRRLTDLEGEAIINDDWREVAEQQSRKAQLQTEIQRALALFRAPSTQGHAAREMECKFSSAAGELMALERRNADLIAAKRKRRQAESARLALTLRDLHGVRRAYGSCQHPHWQSYS